MYSNNAMPPKSVIESNKNTALNALVAVLDLVNRKNHFKISLRSLLAFLSGSLLQLKKLSTLCGLSLVAFLNSSNFLTAEPTASGSPPTSAFKSSTPIDFDKDGDIDIADANPHSGDASLLVHSFSSFDKMRLPASIHADLIAAYDIDGDGDSDIILLNKDNGNIQVLENRGTEGFTPHQPSSLQTSINDASISNLGGDEAPEVVFSGPNVFGIAKNSGTEGFVPVANLPSDSSGVDNLVIADYDSDGDNDVVFSKIGAPGIFAAKNQGSENFSLQTLDSEVSGISDIKVADLDGDGQKDLVFTGQNPALVGWAKNNGSDNFLPAQPIASDLPSFDQLEVADIDYDQDIDIVAASSDSGAKFVLQNNGTEGFVPSQIG